ncbi:MAG: RluA family pseudouridine synthase [Elusimicrobia bacterium]|nr:RluA family pseudouridine synthase [Elusimicrobiota bacterium]
MSEVRYIADGASRIDQFLARRLPNVSRSHVRALIERGAVLVDGVRRSIDFRLRGGELVRVDDAPRGWPEEPFEDWVIHEDKDLLVLAKPAGLLVHPLGESWLRTPAAALEEPVPNLAGLLLKHRPACRTAGVARCGIVHRLDRPTSGVMLVAKSLRAEEALLADFRERRIAKVYRAVVLGTVAEKLVDAPIGRAPGHRKVKVTPFGREASTGFRIVSKGRGISLVEARPLTGRTHQIRAHLAVIGNPVLGDPETVIGPARRQFEALKLPEPPRLLLHAYKVSFRHPGTGKSVSYTAPAPKDFTDYWKASRK